MNLYKKKYEKLKIVLSENFDVKICSTYSSLLHEVRTKKTSKLFTNELFA